MSIDWTEAPAIFVYRPACPRCWSAKYIAIRSEANGDNSTTRKAICKRCSQPFKIVVEPLPENGNGDTDG